MNFFKTDQEIREKFILKLNKRYANVGFEAIATIEEDIIIVTKDIKYHANSNNVSLEKMQDYCSLNYGLTYGSALAPTELNVEFINALKKNKFNRLIEIIVDGDNRYWESDTKF